MEYKPFEMKATTAGYSTPFEKNYGIGLPEGGVGPMQFNLGDIYSKTKDFLSEENLDKMQTGLTAAGVAPGVGVVPDIANTLLSLGRGKWVDAGVNLLTAVPGFGQFVAGGKLTHKAVKTSEKISDRYSKIDATKSIADHFVKNTNTSKKDANVIAAASNKELKNTGVTNLPTNKKKTYKQAWGNMTAVMKKKYKNFKDFENQAIAYNKRKQTLKT